MNKHMRDLQNQIVAKAAEAKTYTEGEAKDLEKASALLDEVDALQKELEIESRLEKAGKVEAEKIEAPAAKVNGAKAMVKMALRRSMTEDEKALITGDDATYGENYLVPEDVRLAINELRKSYVSAKNLVNVISTNALTGSVNYESGTPAGLTNFDDGDAITEETNIAFTAKTFSVEHYGKLLPISNILLDTEEAGLLDYLNRWFVKNAILTENAQIFAALKAGYASGTPKSVAGWEALKASITVDLDPSVLFDGVIITNQSGFACLDAEKDSDGRPVLQSNPAQPTAKLFQGLPIYVFPDAQLANLGTTESPAYPMIYGSVKAGCTFVDKKGLEFATSKDYGFNKNQTYMRVIESFDVIGGDTSAYIYGSFTATPSAS